MHVGYYLAKNNKKPGLLSSRHTSCYEFTTHLYHCRQWFNFKNTQAYNLTLAPKCHNWMHKWDMCNVKLLSAVYSGISES